MEQDTESFRQRTEKGVFGYLTPPDMDEAPETRANVLPESFKYRFESGDRINIWSGSGTLLIYKVKALIDEGAGASFEGGGFDLTEGETYYSSHPLIRDLDEDYESLTTTYVGQKQTDNGAARHLAKYYYTYASAPCTNGNTSFTYITNSSFLWFEITVPKAMTLTELTVTADSPVFALNGKTDMKTGVFTAEQMSDVMTLALDNIVISEDNLVLSAYMCIAPCNAAKHVIRLKDSSGKIYTSPVISKTARGANKIAKFETMVFEGEESPVAMIGNVPYLSLAEAVADVPTDGTATTIKMVSSEAIDVVGSAITVPATKNIILDLNGQQVVGTAEGGSTSALITNKGQLTIKDSSDTDRDGTGKGQLISGATTTWIYDGGDDYSGSYASNTITNTGTLTIESGYVENLSTGSATYAVDNNSSGADAILNVNGGVLKAHSVAVRQFANSTAKENTVNVSGGTVEAGYSGIWIQLPGSDATKAMKAALNVTGGTLTGGTLAFYDYTYGNLFDATQYNLSGGFFNGEIFSYGANINITGGTFSNDVAVKQSKPSEVAVSGGKFAGDVYTYGDNASGGFITGGVFASLTYEDEGETLPCDWCNLLAEGYTVVENTDESTMADYPYAVGEAVVAQIGDVKYVSLADAITAVPTDGTETTITMISNEAVVAGVTIPADKNIVLELNGKTISGNTDSNTTYALITNKGTLVIQDNTDTNKDGTGDGLITTYISNPDGGDVPGYASNTITNNGALTVKSGKIVNNGSGYACFAIDNQTNAGLYSPVLNIEGGRMQQMNEYTYAVRMFCNSTSKVNTVAVSGGVVEGGYGLWLQTPNTSANKASLTITGGTLNADDGAALYVGGTKADNSNVFIAVSGGTINGTGAIIQGPLSGTYGDVSFSGGDMVNVQCGANVEKFITGGVYHNEPNAAFIADGYKAVEENGVWTIVELDPVATVNDVPYKTLKAALEAVGTGPGTIKLIANVDLGTEGLVIGADQEVTIALGNYSITGAVNGKLITNNGNLTFTGSNGTVYNTDVSAQGHDAVYNAAGATLTIKGGHFGDSDTDRNNANSINRGGAVRNFGTAVISGGYFTACDNFTNGGYAYAIINDGDGDLTFSSGTVYGRNNGNFAVNDGTVLIKGGTSTVSGTQSYNCVYNEAGDVTITGGNFRKENHTSQSAGQKAILRLDGNGSFDVRGGTYFGGAIDDSYVASGYQQITYESVGETVRQVLGTTSVNTYSDIKLTTPGIYVLESDITANTTYAGGVMSSGYTEIDLNGHDLTLNGNERPAFNFRNKQVAVINGPGSVTSNTNDYSCVMANGNDVVVTINGGNFTANANGSECIYCYSGNIIINGGTFKVTGENASFLLNCNDSNRAAGKAWITVKGGTFWNFDPSDNSAEGANTNFVAQGYHVVSDSSSQPGHVLYTVVAD